MTRTASEIPDTNDFILTVIDSDGNEIYNGKYGDSPVSFSLPPGCYTVSAVSCDFKAPKFSAPQFGDRQVVLVSSGEDSYTDLVCRQLNCGVRLNIAPDFLTSFPNGSLLLKSTATTTLGEKQSLKMIIPGLLTSGLFRKAMTIGIIISG